jgi:hypothetical protein
MLSESKEPIESEKQVPHIGASDFPSRHEPDVFLSSAFLDFMDVRREIRELAKHSVSSPKRETVQKENLLAQYANPGGSHAAIKIH